MVIYYVVQQSSERVTVQVTRQVVLFGLIETQEISKHFLLYVFNMELCVHNQCEVSIYTWIKLVASCVGVLQPTYEGHLTGRVRSTCVCTYIIMSVFV